METRRFAPTAVTLAAAVIISLAGLNVAWAEQTESSREFAVISGDACQYGSAKGTVTWRRVGPLVPSVVEVSGLLTDQVGSSCRSDGYLTIIEFTAHNGDRVVDIGAASVNNDSQAFRLRLEGETLGMVPRPDINQVSARICRQPQFHIGTPPHYCGPLATFMRRSGEASQMPD